MSSTHSRPSSTCEPTTATDPGPADGRPEPCGATGDVRDAGSRAGRRWWRTTASRLVTALAALLVLVTLLVPHEIGGLTPAAFLRLPVEALLGVAVLLVLPIAPGARRVIAGATGAVLGLLALLAALDMGFHSALSRPFDPVLDWVLLDDVRELLTSSVGYSGAIAALIGALAAAAAVVVLTTLAAVRLTRAAGHRPTAATRALAVLTPLWVICALLGTEVAPGVPVAAASAATHARDRAVQIHAGLLDQEAFAAEAAVDAFRDIPTEDLLTALRGKDVVLSFVESYGRDAIEDPEYATEITTLLDAGTERLATAGFDSRSAYLTSPTAGGGSWLAHATLLSGLWIDNEQRYRTLLSSDRFTLTRAFHSAAWRTVGVMPGLTYAWPEGDFYGYDHVYDSHHLGYAGPNFGWAPVPDQFTLSAFERLERTAPDHAPVMAEIPLVSSHWPWAPLPRIVDWDAIGDGSVYQPMIAEGESLDAVWSDPARVRTEYRRSLEYSLESLVSYVETHGDDDLVLVFLGDHQPTANITGDDAGRDVPVTIVTRDQAVLDRVADWNWEPGLAPTPHSPVWRMDTFRDRFLTAFGPPTEPT